MNTAVYQDQPNCSNRLTALGLDEEILSEAAQQGLFSWASCTPNHPPTYPGSAAWAETIRALAERLIVRGWRRVDEACLPLIVNGDGSIAITVWTGDAGTGRADKQPGTKYGKGEKARALVSNNYRQAELFPEEEMALWSESKSNEDRVTWVLLVHRDTYAREVRCELSRPVGIAPDKRVDGWIERILLTPIAFDDDAIELPLNDESKSPDVDVAITRRA